MAKSKSNYNMTFWQLFSVVVIAIGLGVLITYYAYGNVIQDEIDSISFTRDASSVKTETKTPVKKPAVKKPAAQ